MYFFGTHSYRCFSTTTFYSNGHHWDIKTALHFSTLTSLQHLGVTPRFSWVPRSTVLTSCSLFFFKSQNSWDLSAGLHTPVWPLKSHYRKRDRNKERKIDERTSGTVLWLCSQVPDLPFNLWSWDSTSGADGYLWWSLWKAVIRPDEHHVRCVESILVGTRAPLCTNAFSSLFWIFNRLRWNLLACI